MYDTLMWDGATMQVTPFLKVLYVNIKDSNNNNNNNCVP